MKKTNSNIAQDLYESALNLRTITPIANLMYEKDIENAYQIQEIVMSYFLEKGAHFVGRKIGLTSTAVQQQLGVHEPDFGTLLDIFDISKNKELSISQLIQGKCEAEIAIVLKENIYSPIQSTEELIPKIQYVSPAIEIVDSRIENWDISIYDTIADNASSAFFVIGENKVPPENVDWKNASMQMQADDELVSEGTAANCLGSPLNALLWLANKMIALEKPLGAGEIILTGALGKMHNLTEPETIKAEIETLGSLTLNITQS